MQNLTKLAPIAASIALLVAVVPTALASGGRAAGGGGGTATPPATGGGGGGNSGGVKDVPGAPPAPGCATFASATAPVGYYSIWAAVWNDFTVRSCSTGSQTYTVRVTETNAATGLVDYDVSVPYVVTANQQVSGILDNDFAPFDTTYSITMTVSDSSGTTLDTRTVAATTPAAR